MGGLLGRLRHRNSKTHATPRGTSSRTSGRNGRKKASKRETTKREEITVLVLGTSEAGKSTFLKQLRVVHGEGYNQRERAGFRYVIRLALYEATIMLVDGAKGLGNDLSETVERHAEVLRRLNLEDMGDLLESSGPLPEEHVEAMRLLWKEPAVRSCYDRRSELSRIGLHLTQSSGYFLDRLERVAGRNYVPTMEDTLRARLPTSGIHDYTFTIEKSVFRVYDVGGQRSDRRKWIHCFENDVNAIIFICAINEFDMVLAEDDATNRLEESIALFRSLLEYPKLKDSTVILFLNKTDLFAERLQKGDFSRYFPAYTGPPTDVNRAGLFIMDLFAEAASEQQRDIYAHFTCATDTQNMRVVFDAVKTKLLKDWLVASGLLIE